MNDLKKQLEVATGGIDTAKLKDAKAALDKILKLAEAENIDNTQQFEDINDKLGRMGEYYTQLDSRIAEIEKKLKGGKSGN